MADTKDAFPFIYGKTNLFDEFKFRAYRQQVFRFQRIAQGLDKFTEEEVKKYNLNNALDMEIIAAATGLAFKSSQKMHKALNDSEIKRNALFTHDSVTKHFDLKNQLKNYGIMGRIVSFFMTRNY